MASTLESLAARASIALCVLAGCGSASMATTPVRAPSSVARQRVLDGRFDLALPAGTALEADDRWGAGATPSTFDAYSFERAGCHLVFALRSDGRLRPSELPSGPGERLARAADGATDILWMPERSFDTLGDPLAAVGAVAFEPDGSATDLWVWPTGDEPVEADADDDWLALQRRDPRIARCLDEARAWLAAVAPTLRALRPFASPAELTFGWDRDADAPARHRADLPPGWVVTSAEAHDATFTYLHRRLPWAPSASAPTPSACLWTFEGGGDPSPAHGPRRTVLGRDLTFDREGCARFPVPHGAQHLCVTGPPEEREAILSVLDTFTPVRDAPSSP